MIFRTKLLSTSLDDLKRRIAKILVTGLKDVRTAPEAAPYGTDSNPIDGMTAIFAETGQKGKQVVVGYLNKNLMAAKGEHRIFSTDSNGELKFYIWLHSDGTCDFGGNANHLTQYEALKAAFDQLKTDFNNLVSVYNTHVHSGVTTGSGSSGPTPNSGTSSSADMSGAKLDNLKTQ